MARAKKTPTCPEQLDLLAECVKFGTYAERNVKKEFVDGFWQVSLNGRAVYWEKAGDTGFCCVDDDYQLLDRGTIQQAAAYLVPCPEQLKYVAEKVGIEPTCDMGGEWCIWAPSDDPDADLGVIYNEQTGNFEAIEGGIVANSAERPLNGIGNAKEAIAYLRGGKFL